MDYHEVSGVDSDTQVMQGQRPTLRRWQMAPGTMVAGNCYTSGHTWPVDRPRCLVGAIPTSLHLSSQLPE